MESPAVEQNRPAQACSSRSIARQKSVPSLASYLYTLHLFTANDIVSVLIPQTLFAISVSLSPALYHTCAIARSDDDPLLGSSSSYATLPYLVRLALAVVWIQLQLLTLDTSNQRHPHAVAEDSLNKPWRPIPAGRISPESTARLLATTVAVTMALACAIGNALETLLLFTLNWLYNDVGLADAHWTARNALNAVGITAIGAGAARALVMREGCLYDATLAAGWSSFCPSSWWGDCHTLFSPFAQWLGVCAAVLLTTIHAQDLYDQIGDAARGRSTLPLDLGDSAARWMLAVAVLLWSAGVPFLCWCFFGAVGSGSGPSSWAFPSIAHVVAWHDEYKEHGHGVPAWGGWAPGAVILVAGVMALGLLIATRVMLLRNVVADKRTFKVWAAWTVCLYALPVFFSKG